MKHFTLAAFSAEQRMAAVAIFRNSQLEDLQLRHIVPDISKASGSVRQLVTRVIEQYTPEFIAISCPSAKAAGRTRALCDVVKQIASDFGIPATEVNDCTLRLAYGHPPLTRKEHVRRAGRLIWPSLCGAKSRRAAVDAATTGLYVQTERLFSLHEVAR